MKKIKVLSLGLVLSLGAEMNVWASDDATPFPDEQYAQVMGKLGDGDTSGLDAFFGDSVRNIIITNPKYFNLSLKFAQHATPDEYLGALNDLSRVRYTDLDASAAVASKIENIIENPAEKKRLLYKFLNTVAASGRSNGLLRAITDSVDTVRPQNRQEKLTQLIDEGFFDLSAIGGEDGYADGYDAEPWQATLPPPSAPPIYGYAAVGHGGGYAEAGHGYAAAGHGYGYGGGEYNAHAMSAPLPYPAYPHAASAAPYSASAPSVDMADDDIDSIDISDVRGLLEIFGAVGDPEIEGNLKFLKSKGIDLQRDVFDNVSDADSLRETVSTLATAILAGSY